MPKRLATTALQDRCGQLSAHPSHTAMNSLPLEGSLLRSGLPTTQKTSVGTPRHWSPGRALHLVTHNVGGSHVHLVIVLLTLSGSGHLCLVLNLRANKKAWHGQVPGPQAAAGWQHTRTPHPARLSTVGAATQISDNGQLPSLVLLRQDRRMPTYCWARCTEASVQAFWGMECH